MPSRSPDPAAGLAGNIHGHHEFGTELARRIHRHRADHAAIDEVVLTDGHRLEHAGNAAGRAHCLAGIAAHEHGAFAIFQTRGDRRERLAQFFDRFAAQLFVDVVLQFLALHQATGKQPHIADAGLVERNGLSCIWNASMPLAYSAPTTLPALVPDTTTGAKPLASSILITPICAKPLAAPPPSATPILMGLGASAEGACTTGAGVAGRGSPRRR